MGETIRFEREEMLGALRDGQRFDFVIVGGGATGLGAAVEAASRGHSVALVEAHDFAKGTSSRSTKLVHGGVRYLKQGNISLVVEALKERGLLARNAPHLVRDLEFVIPTYKWWDGPFYGIGLKVYDGLAGSLGLGKSRVLSKEETIEHIPNVTREGLLGGVAYHDGQFDDARLAIDLARTAAREGAVVVNRVRCVGLEKNEFMVNGIRLRDEESGEDFSVAAQCVINATGVFVDELRRFDVAEAPSVVTVSQGIHLVLPKRYLPGKSAVMVPKTSDDRVFFAVPWHDRVVVGTTDTPVEKASIEPRALEEEKAFVFGQVCEYLDRDPKPEEVLSVFAGLRPLVRTGDSADTAALSRDHTVMISESGLVTVTGGKWTTYRKMGEDTIDQAEMVAGVEVQLSETKELTIEAGVAEWIDKEELSAEDIKRYVREEMARTVEDVLARRTRWLLMDARKSMAMAPQVAELMGKELGWNAVQVELEVTQYCELARGYVFQA